MPGAGLAALLLLLSEVRQVACLSLPDAVELGQITLSNGEPHSSEGQALLPQVIWDLC